MLKFIMEGSAVISFVILCVASWKVWDSQLGESADYLVLFLFFALITAVLGKVRGGENG